MNSKCLGEKFNTKSFIFPTLAQKLNKKVGGKVGGEGRKGGRERGRWERRSVNKTCVEEQCRWRGSSMNKEEAATVPTRVIL